MREIVRLDAFAMDAVADYLEGAASDILLADLNWPEPQTDTAVTAMDLHAESARLWTEAVVERLEAWAERARRIAASLQRHEARSQP